MNLLTQPVGLSHYLAGRRDPVRLRRGLHGHQAERLGRADGHRIGAQRGQPELRGLRQPVLRGDSAAALGLDGQMIALFVIVLAAAEAAVALAIALSYYNSHVDAIDVDRRADETDKG